MEIYTIGFTKKSAERFFTTLRQHRIKRLIDVRISNSSQLAGYSKQQDLIFFLRELNNAEYKHDTSLAPTPELLKLYRSKSMTWPEYEKRFMELLQERAVEKTLDKRLFEDPTVLLCTEPTADKCHRRLVVEYLSSTWGDVTAHHL